MSGRSRRVFLLGVMAGVAAVTAGLAILILYRAALDQQRARLAETARSHARLVEEMARFQDRHAGKLEAGGQHEGVLQRVVDAHRRYDVGSTAGEITLGRREGDAIVFFLTTRRHVLDAPKSIVTDARRGQPMRRALAGLSGTMVGLDDRGVRVLAAYEPLRELGWGVVAEVELARVRAPFVRAAAATGGAAIVVILVGTALFFRVSTPLITHLEESEERNRLTVETALDAIVTIDAAGLVTGWNGQAEASFGWSKAEVVGRPLVETIIPPDYRASFERGLRTALETGEWELLNRRIEGRAVHRDGRELPIEIAVTSVRLHGSVGFSAFLRDLTAQKRAAEELRRAQKLAEQRERLAEVGAIAARIVHELGNPIAGVSAQAQLLLRRIRRDENQPVSVLLKPVERIMSATERLGAVITEFKDFSRQQRLRLVTFEVGPFLQDIVTAWQAVAVESGISLVVASPDGVSPRVRADGEKLRRVLDDLVANAIEAIGQGPGLITIEVHVTAEERVRISVRDSGARLPRDVDVFSLSESTKAEGSGLGLTIATEIIGAHGGALWFERAMPTGSVFHVDLPAA